MDIEKNHITTVFFVEKKENIPVGLNFPCLLRISGNSRRPIRAQGHGAYTPVSECPTLKI